MTQAPELLLDDLVFPQGPRWHDGRLWFSDMHAGAVIAVDEAGVRATIVSVPGQPSGLGWLPHSDPLAVSMEDRRLLRFDGRRLGEHADLNRLAPFHSNDMAAAVHGATSEKGGQADAERGRQGTLEAAPNRQLPCNRSRTIPSETAQS